MDDKKYDLEDRLVSFAADIAIFCREIPKDLLENIMATNSYVPPEVLRLILVKLKAPIPQKIMFTKRVFP